MLHGQLQVTGATQPKHHLNSPGSGKAEEADTIVIDADPVDDIPVGLDGPPS
jgi:hypothetical protein